jgi:hypothetical protein
MHRQIKDIILTMLRFTVLKSLIPLCLLNILGFIFTIFGNLSNVFTISVFARLQ